MWTVARDKNNGLHDALQQTTRGGLLIQVLHTVRILRCGSNTDIHISIFIYTSFKLYVYI